MAHATSYADLTTSEKLQYAASNSSYDTFQVVPGADYSFSAYELFSFAVGQYTDYYSAPVPSVQPYYNASDFYADRGVKSFVSNWTVSEGSQIVGMYRAAGLAHSVNLTNSTGTVWNTTVGQGQPFGNWTTWIESLDSSRNIDVGAIGDVNMSLAASWKTKAGVNDPVWADGLTEMDKIDFSASKDGIWGDYSATVYGDQPELNGGLISMVAYDVTDLLKAMGYTDIENAFMFTWEDWNWGTDAGKLNADFDYNDMVYIMTNVTPNMVTATPEPATMLIFGLGIAGLGLARRRRK